MSAAANLRRAALACGRDEATRLPGSPLLPAPFAACLYCHPGRGCVVRSAAHIRGTPADELRGRVLRHDRRNPGVFQHGTGSLL